MKNLIVLPAFNEEACLPEAIAQLQELPDSCELLIVNDGSQDRTWEVAEELVRTSRLRLHVMRLPINLGIGGAVQTGYNFAVREGIYRYVIQFDADGQHIASYIPHLIQACEDQNLDLCIGSRFLVDAPGSYRSTLPRRLGIRFFCRLIGFLSGTKVTDPTSGLRCAGPRAWQYFAKHYPEDYPEPESVYWCARNRLRIGEVPVRMQDRQGGISSISMSRAVYYMLKVSLAILFDFLRNKEHAS